MTTCLARFVMEIIRVRKSCTELISRPLECLEYVLVHETVHLLEPSHNQRFKDLMTRFLPDWKRRRAMLTGLPLADAPPLQNGCAAHSADVCIG
jgi:hypothetical protein